MINNRTVKPKYAHQGGRNPPIVVLQAPPPRAKPPST
ncbi:MAG: hypothetical protein QGH94_09005 [Phycisphaerae bacterium]|nr:hypothetical protein [Phycisphaerae bacterium]